MKKRQEIADAMKTKAEKQKYDSLRNWYRLNAILDSNEKYRKIAEFKLRPHWTKIEELLNLNIINDEIKADQIKILEIKKDACTEVLDELKSNQND